MKILVACEESQEVCKAFRAKGHEAYSCDIIEPSGGHPEWHIKEDVLPLLNGTCRFQTLDGQTHEQVEKWDMIIAFPPCTFLTISGNSWFNIEKYGESAKKRYKDRYKAIVFFMQIASSNANKIAIENPIGVMNTAYRKPDQIIQPWMFGHPYTKSTCLWLKGLAPLFSTDILEKPKDGWVNQQITKDGRYGGFGGKWGMKKQGKWLRYGDPEVSKERSKTFPGIAKAMAEQWG